ncbi:hypothetical protein ACJX0J_026489, partial [Zea mays]
MCEFFELRTLLRVIYFVSAVAIYISSSTHMAARVSTVTEWSYFFFGLGNHLAFWPAIILLPMAYVSAVSCLGFLFLSKLILYFILPKGKKNKGSSTRNIASSCLLASFKELFQIQVGVQENNSEDVNGENINGQCIWLNLFISFFFLALFFYLWCFLFSLFIYLLLS